MLLLFVISSVFTFIGYWKPRPWALVLPFVVWLGIARLGDLGILSDKTTTESAILAGVVGAAFALLGFLLSAGRPRTTLPAGAVGGTAADGPGEDSTEGRAVRPGTAADTRLATPRTSRPRSTKAR